MLQPLADGLKLLIKELIIPLKGNKYLFLFSPVLFLGLSFASWSVIPFETHYLASPNLAILVFLAFSSLSVYGVLLGGWASNSRYAFLGALRSASQMISYELVLSLLILLVCILSQSFNFIDIVIAQTTIWFFVPLLPFVLIYMIAILAETNRTPFDLPEAEAELVAGYSVEYSSGPFAFYFIAEYCNLIIWSNITVILFFGGWLSTTLGLILPPYVIFALKSLFILLLFCWIRAALPRYRWDQLLVLAWRIYLPLVLAAVFWVSMLAIISLTETNIYGFYIGIFLTKVDRNTCLLCKKMISYYAVFILYIRSFLIKDIGPQVIYSFVIFINLLRFFDPDLSMFTVTYLWLYLGINLIFYDYLGSSISMFIQENPTSYLATYLCVLKESHLLVKRHIGTQSFKALIIGTTPMTATGRAALIGAAVSGGSWFINEALKRRALSIENQKNREAAAFEANKNREAAAMEANKNREAAASEANKNREIELKKLELEKEKLEFEKRKYDESKKKKNGRNYI